MIGIKGKSFQIRWSARFWQSDTIELPKMDPSMIKMVQTGIPKKHSRYRELYSWKTGEPVAEGNGWSYPMTPVGALLIKAIKSRVKPKRARIWQRN